MQVKTSMNMPEFPIYVINLDASVDRLEHIGGQLTRLQLPFNRFGAVNGKDLTEQQLAQHYDAKLSQKLYQRDLSVGEIGCALSHIGVYRSIIQSDISYALILEDDANLSQNLPAVLNAIALQIKAEENVVYMLNHVHRYSLRGSQKLIDLGLLCPIVDAYCANGYIVTRASAMALLEYLYPVHRVADSWTAVQKQGISKVIGLVPYVIGHFTPHAEKSTIETERAGLHVKRHNSMRVLLRKYLYQKFIYQLVVKPLFKHKKQKTTW